MNAHRQSPLFRLLSKVSKHEIKTSYCIWRRQQISREQPTNGVIETRVDVWKSEKTQWEHEPRRTNGNDIYKYWFWTGTCVCGLKKTPEK